MYCHPYPGSVWIVTKKQLPSFLPSFLSLPPRRPDSIVPPPSPAHCSTYYPFLSPSFSSRPPPPLSPRAQLLADRLFFFLSTNKRKPLSPYSLSIFHSGCLFHPFFLFLSVSLSLSLSLSLPLYLSLLFLHFCLCLFPTLSLLSDLITYSFSPPSHVSLSFTSVLADMTK